MSPPIEIIKEVPKTDTIEVEDSSNFGNMEELLHCEQQNVLNLLSITLKIAPNMLGQDTIKINKLGM